MCVCCVRCVCVLCGVQRELGSGRFSKVYDCVSLESNQEFAVKVINKADLKEVRGVRVCVGGTQGRHACRVRLRMLRHGPCGCWPQAGAQAASVAFWVQAACVCVRRTQCRAVFVDGGGGLWW